MYPFVEKAVSHQPSAISGQETHWLRECPARDPPFDTIPRKLGITQGFGA